MGAGGSAAGKAYSEWTEDEVADGIETMGEAYKPFAAHVKKEGFDGA